jgi:hypothetical protein
MRVIVLNRTKIFLQLLMLRNELALKTDVTFWNSYLGAMGGKSSIIRWAAKKPPLAQKDFVHFTYTGADTLSELLASSMFTVHEIDTFGKSAAKTILPARVPVAPLVVLMKPRQETGTRKSY